MEQTRRGLAIMELEDKGYLFSHEVDCRGQMIDSIARPIDPNTFSPGQLALMPVYEIVAQSEFAWPSFWIGRIWERGSGRTDATKPALLPTTYIVSGTTREKCFDAMTDVLLQMIS